MLLGTTDKHSIHLFNGKITVYDKRMDNHLPFTLIGEDADDFLAEIEGLPTAFMNGDALHEYLNSLCEEMKERSRIR